MSDIRFYLLDQASLDARLLYACRIIEKAYTLGRKVYVHANDKTQAHALDEILWNFKPESFVPHNLNYEETPKLPPVQIGFYDINKSEPPAVYRDVMVNLADDAPEFYPRFTRVIEILCQEEHVLSTGRARWKAYQQQGHTIQKHDIKM